MHIDKTLLDKIIILSPVVMLVIEFVATSYCRKEYQLPWVRITLGLLAPVTLTLIAGVALMLYMNGIG